MCFKRFLGKFIPSKYHEVTTDTWLTVSVVAQRARNGLNQLSWLVQGPLATQILAIELVNVSETITRVI